MTVYSSIVALLVIAVVSCATSKTEIRYFPIEGANVAPLKQALTVCDAEADQYLDARIPGQGQFGTSAEPLRAMKVKQNFGRGCMGRYGWIAREVVPKD